MKATTRRKLEMGKRALDFSSAHPESSPGYTAVLAQLKALLARADLLAGQQQDGFLQVRTATLRKRELQKALKQGPLHHLTRVGRLSGADLPDLPEKLVLGKTDTYFAFRTAARRMLADATANKDLLEQHGLSQTAFDNLNLMLDQFDAAMDQSTSARQAHVGASVELDTLGSQVVDVVMVMDGLNHIRFGKDTELMGAWDSAKNVVATAKPTAAPKPADGQPPVSGGEVKSAA
jgi:hypothetical protein